jgi:tRNA A-37 threonylcarbamoyl transferase component Bud32
MNDITHEKLMNVLSKMLEKPVSRASCQTEQLRGGTVGDVRLVTGTAVAADGRELQYKLVLKTQKKWERPGDPDSWRREYDLYTSDLSKIFTGSLRRPVCFLAEMNADQDETRLWMEYIDGVSGLDLTVEMFERAAYEIGRFQGRIYAEQPDFLRGITNLSGAEAMKDYYLFCRSHGEAYGYIRSDGCELPKHLREMLIGTDANSDEIWERIEKLPVVLCHRDFWVTNIFYRDGEIVLIDWDTAGWSYMGEDIKSLIADEADVNHMVEYYQKCVPAYYKGFAEYADVSNVTDDCVYEMILVNLGYRLVEWYMSAGTPDKKALQLDTLQKIYEMRNGK